MKAFLSSLFACLIIVCCLFLLEGACFRLVEDYAKKRLELAWGKPGNGRFNSFLKNLPLDHFILPPSTAKNALERIDSEHDYANRIMSFGRPTRDRLKEQVLSAVHPLNDYEIKDVGDIEGVIFPGLQKPATREEVQKKLARRIDDPLEFAKGLLIRVVPSLEKHQRNTEFSRLEAVFEFVLRRGMACVVLSAFDAEDLLMKAERLSEKSPLIAKNLYLWGDHEGADIILEATRLNPSIFKSVFVNSPTNEVKAPNVRGMPWVLFGLAIDSVANEKSVVNALSWVDRGRDSDRLYPSRLGGLMKIVHDAGDFESFVVAYMLEALDYTQEIGNAWPQPKALPSKAEIEGEEFVQMDERMQSSENFNLLSVEEKIRFLQKNKEITDESTATFECEIVRGYRELHFDDSNLRKVSNRDLVLKLGRGFEEMGQDVLESVGNKDPLFLRFYNSLKEVEDSPLN